jgi:cytochrome c oxidase subunit II
VTPATKWYGGPGGGYDAAALRSRRRNRRLLALLACVAAVAALLTLAPSALADVFTPESGGSKNADDIDSLYKIVLYISIPIFLLVEGVLLYSLIKFRQRRGGPEPVQIRGNSQLELGWTVGAAVVLVILAVTTFLYLGGIKNPAASGPDGLASGVQVASIDQPAPPAGKSKPLTIRVNGQQYVWRFQYPGGDFSYFQMVVPTNTTVVLKITSSDVAHSWWIPKLGGKADAVPGHTNETWFKITKPGVYKGQCAELCGQGHADMRGQVLAVSPTQYTSFIERKQRQIQAAETDLSKMRAEREKTGQED